MPATNHSSLTDIVAIRQSDRMDRALLALDTLSLDKHVTVRWSTAYAALLGAGYEPDLADRLAHCVIELTDRGYAPDEAEFSDLLRPYA